MELLLFCLQTRQWKDSGRRSQLDCILERKMDSSMTYIHSKVKLWSTWDHHPVYATISEDDGQGYFTQQTENMGWSGWMPYDD